MLSGAAKIGIDLDAVADIHDDQERRPFGQGLGVLLGLAAGAQHRCVPGVGAADAVAAPAPRSCKTSFFQQRWRLLGFAALFGLQHKRVVPIKIDKSGAGRTAGVVKMHRPLEYVFVAFGFAGCRLRPRKPKDFAQLDQEQAVIRALGSGRTLPSADKRGD
jgi:hypothetical protein